MDIRFEQAEKKFVNGNIYRCGDLLYLASRFEEGDGPEWILLAVLDLEGHPPERHVGTLRGYTINMENGKGWLLLRDDVPEKGDAFLASFPLGDFDFSFFRDLGPVLRPSPFNVKRLTNTHFYQLNGELFQAQLNEFWRLMHIDSETGEIVDEVPGQLFYYALLGDGHWYRHVFGEIVSLTNSRGDEELMPLTFVAETFEAYKAGGYLRELLGDE